MKRLKKMIAVVLAVTVAMTMGIASTSLAFAAGEGTTTGTITVKSSEKDTTYDFYRILDLTGKDTSDPADNKYDAVTYKLNSKWNAFFTTGDGKDYLVATNTGNLSPINVNGTTKYINITQSNIVEFTNKAMDYAIQNNIAVDSTTTGTGNDVTVNQLPLGYYLMIPVDASDKTSASSGSVASITSTVPDAEIQVKAKKPEIEKTDNAVSADVGQVITYTITGKVPNTSGYNTYKYVIKDEMTSGLTFNKDIAVTIDGVTDSITDQCKIDSSVDNKFSVDIPVKNLQGTNGANVGKTITITYTATVNDNAVTSAQEKNKTQLEYGHNPDQLEKTTPIEEEVYTAKIDIVKYTGESAGSGTKLANAQFALMNSEGKYYKYTAASGTTPATVEWVTVANAPTSGTANVTDAMAKALADAGDAITTKTTTADGAAAFEGIKDGTYYLVEFVAPDGYNRLDKPQAVTVAGTDADASNTNKTENKADATAQYDSAKNSTANVQNNAGSELPSTGGIGTTIFYILGALLVVGCGIILIARRRMSANN